MKIKFLKKGVISALFLFVFFMAQFSLTEFKNQANSQPCPRQIVALTEQTCESTKSNDSLKEIAKPYLGTYECEWLYYGGVDRKEIFDYLRVELKTKGELLITYKTKRGERTEVPLSYEYDFDEKTLRVTGQWQLLKIDRKFPLDKGEINVVTNLLGKLVNVKFSRK